MDSPFAGGSDRFSSGMWVKLNVCTGDVKVFRLENHFATGDASFVPDPDSDDEDGGVILTAWVDGTADEGETYFRVIDAKTMEEVATVNFIEEEDKKIIMPYAFHGIWLGPE
jgi:carotenoid cleavage dioxygenase-like enzyme